MNENIFSRVKVYMKSKDYSFNESWLEECVQYCLETHPKLSVENIQSFAIEQWLLSDLREINDKNGCLPKNLVIQTCTTLSGNYILQMEKMYDISTPKYKQLEKIRKIDVQNLKETEIKKSDILEPKGNRMFQLFLTDGVQEIEAIEYKPIELFNKTLLPGYKLKIIGPVNCRRGIIMLEAKNVSGLGGEIEDILIKNSLENVLARSLNWKENPDPYNDMQLEERNEKSDDDEEYLNCLEKLVRSQESKEDRKSNSNLNNSSTFNLSSEYKENILKEPNSDDELEALLNDPDIVSEFSPIESVPKAISNIKKIEESIFFNLENSISSQSGENPEFPDKSFDLEDKNWNSSNSKEKAWYKHEDIIEKTKITENQQSNSQTTRFSDFIVEDENIIEPYAMEISKLSKKLIHKTIQNDESLQSKDKKLLFLKSSSIKDDNSKNEDLGIKELGSGLMKGWKIIPNEELIVKSNVIQRQYSLETDSENKNILEHKNSFGTSKAFKSLSPKISSTEKSDEDSNIETSENKSDKGLGLFFKNINSFTDKINTDIDLRLKQLLNEPNNIYLQSNEKRIPKLSFSQPECSSISKINIASLSKFSTEIGAEKISVRNKKLPKPLFSFIRNQPKVCQESNKSLIKVSEVEEKISPLNEEPPPKICDFICDLIQDPLTDEPILKTVRAKILEKEQLSNKGKLWHLAGLISDGTANVKVEFSSEFMDSILGFTALEFSIMKKKVKTDPKLQEQIRRNMRNGQQKLEETDWLMQLKMVKNKTPLVVTASELTQEQKEIFEKRLQMLKPQFA